MRSILGLIAIMGLVGCASAKMGARADALCLQHQGVHITMHENGEYLLICEDGIVYSGKGELP